MLTGPTTITVSAHVEQSGQSSISKLITRIVMLSIPFARAMFVSLSLAPDPHLAWLDGHFARGELEEIVCSPSVCSPFKSLDVSVQQRSSLAAV